VRPDGMFVQVKSADELKDHLLPLLRPGDTVLFKGPRNAGMVKAVRDPFRRPLPSAALWVNLAGIEGNIARFRRHWGQATHVLAMLKAIGLRNAVGPAFFLDVPVGIHSYRRLIAMKAWRCAGPEPTRKSTSSF